MAGAGPALKLTRGVGAQLKQATAGGGGVRFGGVWTAVVVLPTVAFAVFREGMDRRHYPIAIADDEFLANRRATARMPFTTSGSRSRSSCPASRS